MVFWRDRLACEIQWIVGTPHLDIHLIQYLNQAKYTYQIQICIPESFRVVRVTLTTLRG